MNEKTENKKKFGVIKQIHGAVVDIEFDENDLPQIYTACLLKKNNEELVLEVAQHLGGGLVRTIAMDNTDRLSRGMQVESTGEPIKVPVGKNVLGRILNVVGKPVDDAGDIITDKKYPIHRTAPAYKDQNTKDELLITGIKVIDLLEPYPKGGKIGLFGGAGVGKTVLIMELINN
ncbi:MAG TPA: F0F1 ATP synthase subunit beta, partial [Victivallales bacterium]|nr:F0F1 ATP synthase subunit beta [Victivallales bacterium]